MPADAVRGLLAILGALAGVPASAAGPALGEGDVLCFRPGPGAAECAGLGTITATGKGVRTLRVQRLVAQFGLPMRTATVARYRREDRLLCLEAGSVEVSITPSNHGEAARARRDMLAHSEGLAEGGLCFDYVRCEGAIHALAYRGGERDASLDTRFTVLKAGDPAAATLKLRPVGRLAPVVLPPACRALMA